MIMFKVYQQKYLAMCHKCLVSWST